MTVTSTNQAIIQLQLKHLADEIAFLDQLRQDIGPEIDEHINRMCDLFHRVFELLTDDPSLMQGEMPWWDNWSGGKTPSR